MYGTEKLNRALSMVTDALTKMQAQLPQLSNAPVQTRRAEQLRGISSFAVALFFARNSPRVAGASMALALVIKTLSPVETGKLLSALSRAWNDLHSLSPFASYFLLTAVYQINPLPHVLLSGLHFGTSFASLIRSAPPAGVV